MGPGRPLRCDSRAGPAARPGALQLVRRSGLYRFGAAVGCDAASAPPLLTAVSGARGHAVRWGGRFRSSQQKYFQIKYLNPQRSHLSLLTWGTTSLGGSAAVNIEGDKITVAFLGIDACVALYHAPHCTALHRKKKIRDPPFNSMYTIV